MADQEKREGADRAAPASSDLVSVTVAPGRSLAAPVPGGITYGKVIDKESGERQVVISLKKHHGPGETIQVTRAEAAALLASGHIVGPDGLAQAPVGGPPVNRDTSGGKAA